LSTPSIRGRLTHLVLGIVATVVLGAGLGACGNNGTGLARQACHYVNRSIALFEQANRRSDTTRSTVLEQQAAAELRKALPIAAIAAYHDGQWQALMTEVSESNRVPEQLLVPGLVAQCKVADSSVFNQPAPPSSIPPPAPVTTAP
jgi:hypothetical protein